MIHQAEQFELSLVEQDPLEAKLQKQWDENARAQAWQWTPERMAICWWSGTPDYPADPEGWAALPAYERDRWRLIYQEECRRANARHERNEELIAAGLKPLEPYRMQSAAYLAGLAEEAYQRDKLIAEDWAQALREDFKARRPCSIRPEPTYQYLLDWAFQLAQVPVECLAAAETEEAK